MTTGGGARFAGSRSWSASRLAREVFIEEYHDFVRMGLSRQEIARAFACTVEALEHRMKRNGIKA